MRCFFLDSRCLRDNEFSDVNHVSVKHQPSDKKKEIRVGAAGDELSLEREQTRGGHGASSGEKNIIQLLEQRQYSVEECDAV